MTDEAELPPSHAININVLPTEDWLAEVVITTTDIDGDTTVVKLCPHESLVMGQILVRFGLLLDDLNEKLSEKDVDGRREVMELTAQFNMPSATDSPFDPPEG